MTRNEILALPIIQQIIEEILTHCDDTSSHMDRYGFLHGFCEVNSDGETKTVFLHDDWDFVIKIPNYYSYPNTNYCDLEVQHYKNACEYRVEKLLLETAPLITLSNGITLYFQPRYQLNTYHFLSDSKTSKKLRAKLNNTSELCPTTKARRKMYDSYRISSYWFARVVQLYGKKFARSLETWTQKNQIGDLHNCNTGWYNNKPIILDYAGYYG